MAVRSSNLSGSNDSAWPASCRALFATFNNISTKGGGRRPPSFVYILNNAANNALHDAGHAESLLPLRFELLTAT